ncbi:unnamed protein product [Bursaphelenchus okinawaensis]|uniref:Uncharacterized protein n=1 Tax=Bursaphelenchus okinawaensis TaxID=465554 RepID=A0A811L0M7_9BILA|nr:unnamed protein product [Bursaphelenchus okinawaensis]CAG9114606.1 unnamed protein product [Bursaphelenchus okinawaensis]
MQKLLLFVLGVAACGMVSSQFTSGSSFCADEKNLEKNYACLLEGGSSSEESQESTTASGDLEESGSGSGSEEGSGSSEDVSYKYCLLLKYFYNIAVEFKGEAVYSLWLQWIEEVNDNIVLDVSLTSEEKICAIWSSLEAFITVHVEIEEIVYYIYISEWGGYVRNLEAVSVSFDSSVSEAIITLDASEDCELFDALRNQTSGELATYVETLIEEITVILEGGWSYSYELVLIYEKIESFLTTYSQYSAQFLAIEIEGYGSVSSFYEVTAFYWRAYNFDIAVGGSTSDCALIQVLTQAYQNESIGSTSERAQIKELVETLTTYYESNTEVSVRIEYFYTQLYQFLIIQEWSVEIIYSLEISGYGDLYELIYAYVLEVNLGISFENIGGSTTVESSSAGASCSDVTEINDFSANTTDLLTSITEAQESWNSTEIQRFAAYKERIYVVSSNTSATLVERYQSVYQVLTTWTTNEFYLNLVDSIQILTWGGSVSQACACHDQVE